MPAREGEAYFRDLLADGRAALTGKRREPDKCPAPTTSYVKHGPHVLYRYL